MATRAAAKQLKVHARHWRIRPDNDILLIRRGDTVVVTGNTKNEGEGVSGMVQELKGDAVIVSQWNMASRKHFKMNPEGKVVEGTPYKKENWIKLSDVRLQHPLTEQPVTVRLSKQRDKYGNFKRVTTDDGTVIPWPLGLAEGPKDTSLEEALRVTYTHPTLAEPPLPEGVIAELRKPFSVADKKAFNQKRKAEERYEKMVLKAAKYEYGKALALASFRRSYLSGQLRLAEAVETYE